MKCPKCGYISFDYNQRCPKCSKDLVPEQKKRNLAAFKHNPPSLLGTLTGDVNDMESALGADVSGGTPTIEEEDLNISTKGINILTKVSGVNIKEARRRLADKLIAENSYTL